MDYDKELNSLQTKFNDLLEEIIDIVSLDGKTLKDALTTQLPMQLQTEVLVKRLCYLYDQIELEVEVSYSNAFKDEMKDSYRDVSVSEAKEYAKSNAEYKSNRSRLNRVRNLRDEAKGALDVINSRKFTVNNLTNSIVAGVENTIL